MKLLYMDSLWVPKDAWNLLTLHINIYIYMKNWAEIIHDSMTISMFGGVLKPPNPAFVKTSITCVFQVVMFCKDLDNSWETLWPASVGKRGSLIVVIYVTLPNCPLKSVIYCYLQKGKQSPNYLFLGPCLFWGV